MIVFVGFNHEGFQQHAPVMSMSSLPLIRSVSGAASTILFFTAMHPGCRRAMQTTRSTGTEDHSPLVWLLEDVIVCCALECLHAAATSLKVPSKTLSSKLRHCF